jgi:hypothetical protein
MAKVRVRRVPDTGYAPMRHRFALSIRIGQWQVEVRLKLWK